MWYQSSRARWELPTVKYPNPEDKTAFSLALELANREKADIAIATDPDCDRLGVAFKNRAGEYILLNGNQIGVLLTEYVLSSRKAKEHYLRMQQ